MRPIKFEESNKTLTARDPIEALPVYDSGEVIMSCWKMNFKERIKALIHGRIWLQILADQTHEPVSLLCDKSGFVDL